MWILGFFLLSTAWAQIDPTCVDKLSNCDQFPESSCKGQYEAWAKVNCNNTCKYCVGPTKPPPPCEDKIKDCSLYAKTTCDDPSYKHWAEDTCRYFCRKCTPLQLQMKDAHTTTISPAMCKDAPDIDCRLYGKTSCVGEFKNWALTHCMAYCGYCTGLPTPPPVCKDTIPNCNAYGTKTCTDEKFAIWVQDHCAKYCNLCGSGSGGAATPPPLVPNPVTSGPGTATPGPHVILTPPPPGK